MVDQTAQDFVNRDLEKIHRAISELIEKRDVFSQETYTQLLLALYNRRKDLQTKRQQTEPNIASPLQDDEIRLVTVMFIDIVGSTQIAEAIEFENWSMLIGEAHRRFAETVNRWGGEIGQYLGDGLLCFFGARRSRGNDAARAVSCALALQTLAAEYNFEVQAIYDITAFQIRIGISTGRVVVGTIGIDEKSETLAMGTTTNLAARLQSICPPGGVVVDSETHLRTRDEFQFKEQDPVILKGFADPIRHFVVIGTQLQSITKLTSDRIGDISIPFVGRDDVFREILQAIQTVLAQDSGFKLRLFFGDIGIGKSRILQEIASDETTQEFFKVRMVGHYDRRETPYSLLRDMLGALCNLTDALTPRAIEDQIIQFTRDHWDSPLAEAAAAIIGYNAGYGFIKNPLIQSLQRTLTHGEEDPLYDWVRRWLRGVAGHRPILLMVDNIQWADNESLQLLSHLAPKSTKMIVLAAGRIEFQQQASAFFDTSVLDNSILLSPLTEQDTHHIINSVTQHVHNVPDELVQLIIERAEGNPLFVEEFLRMLFDNGVFTHKEGADGWRVNTMQYHMMEDHLPNGLLGVFQARLDDLPSVERRVVQIAAAVGQTFWDGAVSQVTGDNAQERLNNLVNRRIILKKTESRFENTQEYVFRNSLYHDVAYTMLPRSQRVSYHGQIAHWFSGVAATQPDALGFLADHYAQAEQPLAALKSYVAAANYQLERGNPVDTLSLVENGLKVGGKLTREEALPYASQLWQIKGRVAYTRRRYSEASADSQTALMLMNELPDDALLTERVLAAVTLGNAYTSMGNYEEALDALTQSYQLVDNIHNAREQATVLQAFGQLFWARGGLKEAELYQQRALLSAQEGGDPRDIASARAMLGRILLDQGMLGEALQIFESIHQSNREEEQIVYQISDLQHMAVLHHELFNIVKAMELLNKANELCDRINYYSPLVQTTTGITLIQFGETQQGLTLLENAVDIDYYNTHDLYSVQLEYIRGLALTGKDQDCIQAAESFTASVQSHTPVLYGRGLLWMGLAQLRQGDPQALKTLRWAMDNELTYGGRDVWRCHYALSLALPDAENAKIERQRVADTLIERAKNLQHRPALYNNAINIEHAQTEFKLWHDISPTAGLHKE